MTDYFGSDFASLIGAKGLREYPCGQKNQESSTDISIASPADTPYETPAFIRSKRSSRATAGSSRERSPSPPPLPPDSSDYLDKSRDGRYGALDPRRFTPTLHASLVSEILSLRRELDSKNSLVDNLENTLSHAKNDHDILTSRLAESAREVRKAKSQVQQMEKGTYDAVEDLVRERDAVRSTNEDLRGKLDSAQRKTRQQDEDAERTQSIWESEKESWDNERRQLERRVHVTESRLRAMIEEMAAQQVAIQNQPALVDPDESVFKDSAIGNESDTASIRSATTPIKHRRNMSSVSMRQRNVRNSAAPRTATMTPEPQIRTGHSLADELSIDEEDEYDIDELENGEEEATDYHAVRQQMDSRQSQVAGETDAKAKRVLGFSLADPPESPTANNRHSLSQVKRITALFSERAASPSHPVREVEPAPAARIKHQVTYVDNGYQPSPPTSPPRIELPRDENDDDATKLNGAPSGDFVTPMESMDNKVFPFPPAPDAVSKPTPSPFGPSLTPVTNGITRSHGSEAATAVPKYATASTQTDLVQPELRKGHTEKRDSLSPPMFVPSIAIHPPSSRPSSPRPYVLPPGTKNASTQADLRWSSTDASVQTEEIRVDRRPVRLPSHLLPAHLLPSPTFPDSSRGNRPAFGGPARIHTKLPLNRSIPSSSPLISPAENSPEMPRNYSSRDLRTKPLKALPLPRPVLLPLQQQQAESASNGPLNRAPQYGVTQTKRESQHLSDIEQWSDNSDTEDPTGPADMKDIAGSVPGPSRPPQGRFGLSEPPKAVPEDKEISPERRPGTADSYGAAPAPSIASSRDNNSQRGLVRQPPKISTYKDHQSRSPSFDSMASSTQPVAPPYPIPARSSSRLVSISHSEGSQSPTPYDAHGNRIRPLRPPAGKQANLRKVQSATMIRTASTRRSPPKHRRRRRSPDLTPVQSMAFDSPTPTKFPQRALHTKFPIPDLPTPLQETAGFDFLGAAGGKMTSASSRRVSVETSLVDAIAATMVGEWMFKYIRKRKSFGITDDNADVHVQDDKGVVNNVTAHGTRHKRWVWLSPYERTIMWDTKQPTSGPALLGKKGRKLPIQSVMDVEDHTPLPKGAELSTVWKRSILILTPARALKFTAVSAERHHLWMTALAFLAQSGQLPNQVPPMPSKPPPPPPLEAITGVRQSSPSFGRASVRDSIRLAKGRRPDLQKSVSDQGSTAPNAKDPEAPDEGADFPAVPRLYVGTTRHQRKRSNTSPRLPPPLHNLRSFSSSAVPSSSASALQPASMNGSSSRGFATSSKSGSRHASIASPNQPNFFEAVGTVRMEAFVDPNMRDGVLYVPAPPPSIGPRRRRGDSNLSQTTTDKKRAGYVFDENGLDPFKGF